MKKLLVIAVLAVAALSVGSSTYAQNMSIRQGECTYSVKVMFKKGGNDPIEREYRITASSAAEAREWARQKCESEGGEVISCGAAIPLKEGCD